MGHGRTTGRVVKARAKAVSQHWNRPRPKTENPFGIPKTVMKQLASESLPDKESYSKRLNELLRENNG